MTRRGGQNTSAAVMQQRQEARDSLDDFPTPPWATRAVIEKVLLSATTARERRLTADSLKGQTALDPCCNRGHMVRPLLDYFGRVDSADVHDYSRDPRRAVLPQGAAGSGGGLFEQARICDFLIPGWEQEFPRAASPDWIFMNPPFRLAEPFIHRALGLAREGVAVFVRAGFTEGQERYEELFSKRPPTVIAQHAERVYLFKGLIRDPEVPYWDSTAKDGRGAWRRPASATSYTWLIWLKSAAPRDAAPATAFTWIPPCRKAMERPGDYPVNPDQRGVFTPPAAAGQEVML